jgi:uncharacterized protein
MKHHVCIFDDYIIFDGETIPVGKILIEKEITRALSEALDSIVHKIGSGEVVVCGTGDARRMLGRKLEDRLGRVVIYE